MTHNTDSGYKADPGYKNDFSVKLPGDYAYAEILRYPIADSGESPEFHFIVRTPKKVLLRFPMGENPVINAIGPSIDSGDADFTKIEYTGDDGSRNRIIVDRKINVNIYSMPSVQTDD